MNKEFIAMSDLIKVISRDDCDEGCGYIDERDLYSLRTKSVGDLISKIEQAFIDDGAMNEYTTNEIIKIIKEYCEVSEDE